MNKIYMNPIKYITQNETGVLGSDIAIAVFILDMLMKTF
jgi:hypothetical protein